MPHIRHVQSSRIFYNCNSNANHFNECKNLAKAQCKQIFNKALAFQSRVNHRSYAQVLKHQGAHLQDNHLQFSQDSPSLSSSVGTKGYIQGRFSHNKTKGKRCHSSLPQETGRIHVHKQLQQFSAPTSNTPTNMGLNPDVYHSNISLCNRFESLAGLQENDISHLQSCRDEVISPPGGLQVNGSERIHQRNGQRTPTASVLQLDNQQVICAEYEHCREQNGVEFGCVPLSPL